MEVQFSYTNSLALIKKWGKNNTRGGGGRGRGAGAGQGGGEGEFLAGGRAPGDDFVVALEEFSHGLPFGVVREAGEGEAIGGVNLPVRIAAGGLDDAAGEGLGPLQGQRAILRGGG